MYEYKTVAVPKNLACKAGNDMGKVVAEFIESEINKQAKDNWEFYRADNYTVQEVNGCLMALAGQQGKIETYNVLVFRKNQQN